MVWNHAKRFSERRGRWSSTMSVELNVDDLLRLVVTRWSIWIDSVLLSIVSGFDWVALTFL